MTKNNWTTLVVLLPKTLRDLLPKIQTLILGTGLIESYHFRVSRVYPVSQLENSNELRLLICYRILRRQENTNHELESALRGRLNELIGQEDHFFVFNPKEGHPLKEGEGWLDPYDSADQYLMAHHEWVVFIESLGKLSQIVVSMAEQDALSFNCRKTTLHLFENMLMLRLLVLQVSDVLTPLFIE